MSARVQSPSSCACVLTYQLGSMFIDWAARDREIRRQMREGVIDMDKINAAATVTVLQ